ncbi:MAG: putative NTPase [Planctomycetota bacterium]|nr:MAG: putative NTPase [Planctomycetota bacterium]
MMRRAALLFLLALVGCGKEPPAPVIGRQAGGRSSTPGAREKQDPPPDPEGPPPNPDVVEAARRGAILRECEKGFAGTDPAGRLDAISAVEGAGEEALPLLQRGLLDPVREVRLAAAELHVRIARDADEGIPVLSAIALDSKGPEALRVRALEALTALGPRALPAAGALVKAIGDPRTAVAEAAERALGVLGEEAIPVVVDAARRATAPSARPRALKALARLAPRSSDVVGIMLAALLEQDAALRAAAADGLSVAARDSDAVVDALAPFLADPESTVRAAAGRSMRNAGRRALRASEALVKSLGDASAGAHVAALLADLGPDAAPLLDRLRPLLLNSDAAVVSRAALAISAMGASAAPALPDLMCAWEASTFPGRGSEAQASLRSAIVRMGDMALPPVLDLQRGSASRETKSGCLDLLAEMSTTSGDAVAALAELLRDDVIRDEVVHRLEGLGPFAWRSGADLIAAERLAMSDSSREQIYRALGAIGVRDAENVKAVREMMPRAGDRATFLVESLVTAGSEGNLALRGLLLSDPNAPDRRRLAVEVLTAMPGGVDGEVPAVTALLSHPDPETRRAAARALCVVRALPATTVQALAILLDDTSARVRRNAVVALARCGPSAAPAAARLRACDADPDADVRCLALLALGTSGAEARAQDMLLDTLLNDTRLASRAASARALARMTSPGKEVIPALVKALKDRETEVVTEALIALAILGADEKFLNGELKRRDANTKADFGMAAVWACRGINTARALKILVETLRAGLPESQEDIATSLLVKLGPGDADARRELLELCRGAWPGRHAFRRALATRTK